MGRSKYVAAGAIVLFQLDDSGIGKIFLKVEYVPYVGSTPLVYALVVVSHHAYVLIFPCQQLDHPVLDVVGVLIFVNHYVAEPFSVILQYVRIVPQQMKCISEQVVKIHGIVLFEPLLVCLVYIVYGL